MEVLVEGGPGCGDRVRCPYDAGTAGNGGNLSKGTRFLFQKSGRENLRVDRVHI